MPKKPSEADLQRAVIAWWETVCINEFKLQKELLWHTPNGGTRNVVEAMNLKRMGARPGVPDLFLAVARNGHGLFVEMKLPTGKESEKQIYMRELLVAQGYVVKVCHSANDAVTAIRTYLQS